MSFPQPILELEVSHYHNPGRQQCYCAYKHVQRTLFQLQTPPPERGAGV